MPHPQYPNQPAGVPDLYPGNPVYGSSVYAGGYRPSSSAPSGRNYRYVMTDNGPLFLPPDLTDEEASQVVAGINKQIATLTEAWQQSSGLQRKQIEAQIEDLKAQRQQRVDDLRERQRQFDLTHQLDQQRLGLETQRVGLDRARTATDYLATPDRWAQAGNYLALSGRVLAGQPGAGTYGSAVKPTPNTMSDFAVLASGGNPSSGRGSAADAAGAAGGSGGDARQKALKAVLGGYTPSNGVGLDENDFAVLNASRAIMNMNLTPQQQASINSNPEYKAILGSNMRNLGQNPDAWFASQRQTLPGQQSARLA